MEKQVIIDAFFFNGQVSGPKVRSKANAELIKLLEIEYGKFSSRAELIYVALNGRPSKVCECGKPTAFLSNSEGYRDFCSAKCMSSSKNVKQKRSANIAVTCLQKYGSTNVLGNKQFREKAAATMISKYGVDNFAKSPLHKQKVRETSQEKYGTDHPLAAPHIVQQIAKTMYEKYGGHTTKSEILSAKMRATMMNKYGAESSWNSELLLPKLHAIQLSKFIEHAKTIYEVKSVKEGYLEVKHKCGYEFNLKFFNHRGCPGCKGCSKPESELFRYIQSLDEYAIRNDRKILGGAELDIVCNNQNVAFEMNGVYWHHENTDKIPLLEKTKRAAKEGFQLIHIWDYEWYDKGDIIKALIRSKLGKNRKKINARSCTIKVIDLKTSQDFLNTFHLQGSCRSSKKLGMFYQNELVGVATFGKPRYEEFDGLELIRLCWLPDVQVRGGVSKFMSTVNESVLTYADARFSNANGYIAAGFKYVKQTNPGYSWFKSSIGVISRHQTTKKNLPNLLGDNFDPSKTENENMKNNKFLKLVDCGHHKLVLLKSKAMLE